MGLGRWFSINALEVDRIPSSRNSNNGDAKLPQRGTSCNIIPGTEW